LSRHDLPLHLRGTWKLRGGGGGRSEGGGIGENFYATRGGLNRKKRGKVHLEEERERGEVTPTDSESDEKSEIITGYKNKAQANIQGFFLGREAGRNASKERRILKEENCAMKVQGTGICHHRIKQVFPEEMETDRGGGS